MTRDEAKAALDGAAADMVRAYRDIGHLAALVRTDGNRVQIVTLGTMDEGVAKLLYMAADTFADRAYKPPKAKLQ